MNSSRVFKSLLAALLLGASPLFALSVSDVKGVATKVDEAPVPIRTVAPVYPAALRDAGVPGLVSVVLVVDESGTVIASEVAKASREEFIQPSLDAIQAWKFKPAKVGGKVVKVRLTVPLRFTANS